MKSKVLVAAIYLLINYILLLKQQIHGSKRVKDIVSKLGFSFINSDPEALLSLYRKNIQHRIQDVNQQEQDSLILKSSLLDFYKTIYNFGTRDHFVDIINKKKPDRSVLIKLSVSAHDLAIDKGRYNEQLRQSLICLACDLG